MSGLVSTGMGDHLQAGKPPQYVTSNLDVPFFWARWLLGAQSTFVIELSELCRSHAMMTGVNIV